MGWNIFRSDYLFEIYILIFVHLGKIIYTMFKITYIIC